MRRALLLLAGIAVAGVASAAQTRADQPAEGARLEGAAIGRLFYTPSERAALDTARLQKPVAQAPAPQAAEAPPPPPPQIVRYGGIVRRSDGKSMLWINNRLVDEKEALAGLSLKGKVRPDGAVTLQVPETGRNVEVKVGQSVEIHTGKVAETRKQDESKAAPAESKAVPDDAKGKPSDTKGTAAEAKTAPADARGAAADSRTPGSGADSEAAPRTSGPVGLKLDLGTRGLSPAEEQQLRNRSAAK